MDLVQGAEAAGLRGRCRASCIAEGGGDAGGGGGVGAFLAGGEVAGGAFEGGGGVGVLEGGGFALGAEGFGF